MYQSDDQLDGYEKEGAVLAVRSVQDVIDGAVTINIPPHFVAKRVEVIILPLEDERYEAGQLQRLLLRCPTMSADELGGFVAARDWMNKWYVNGF